MFNIFKSQLKKEIDENIQEILYGKNILSNEPNELKDNIKENLFKTISSIKKKNSLQHFRVSFTEAVLYYAELQVICLKEDEKPLMPFASEEKISGKLYKKIKECMPHTTQGKRFLLSKPKVSNQECLVYCNKLSLINLFYMNGLNSLRKEIGDFSEDHNKDWFVPFVNSMLVYYEHVIREKLKLKSLFKKNEQISPLIISAFKNFVCDKVSVNPYSDWKIYYNLD